MRKNVVHFEIGCNNLPETIDFYKKVFDWEIDQKGPSATIETGSEGALPGHISKLGPDDPQNLINIYVETDTIEADLEAIESNGGTKLVGPLPLPDGRSFAWFQDIAGNTVGLITTA